MYSPAFPDTQGGFKEYGMSVCYHVNCHKCKVYLWAGQRDYIYTTIEAMNRLDKFLFKHCSHDLSFNSDNEFEEYEEE